MYNYECSATHSGNTASGSFPTVSVRFRPVNAACSQNIALALNSAVGSSVATAFAPVLFIGTGISNIGSVANSVVAGTNNTASSDSSVAMGCNNVLDGANSVVVSQNDKGSYQGRG